MGERKISGLMVLFSVLGGIVGFVIGELILGQLEGSLSPILLIAIYYGQFAFVVGLFIFLAEIISPELNGIGWRTRYTGQGWKWLIPATFVMLFGAGALLQFVYGLDFGKNQRAQNLVMVMDVSGSMLQTDPQRESIEAAKDLVQRMESDMKTAVITFNERASILQPLVSLRDQAAKDQVIQALDNFGKYDGQTDISLALGQAVEQIESETNSNRKSVVILLSDGYSDVNLSRTLAPFKNNQIAIHTIGVSLTNDEGAGLLQKISSETGGSYFDVKHAENLSGAFDQIYKEQMQRHLVGERSAETRDSLEYAALRIFFLTLIGGLIGLSLGIIFDNRHLALSFAIGGSVGGVLAGFVLEFGLKSPLVPAWGDRLLAAILMAILLSLSTLIIPIKRKYILSEQARTIRGRALTSDPYSPKSSKGFRVNE